MRQRPSKAKRHLADHVGKVAHPTHEGAQAHAGDLNARSGPNGKPWSAYACRWGDSPDAPAEPVPHYHVGRPGQWTRKGVAKP